MIFKEQLQNGSDPILHLENKWCKSNHLVTLKTVSQTTEHRIPQQSILWTLLF
jgi:hypothetical protein